MVTCFAVLRVVTWQHTPLTTQICAGRAEKTDLNSVFVDEALPDHETWGVGAGGAG